MSLIGAIVGGAMGEIVKLQACRSCGAMIGFIATPGGRYIPVDPTRLLAWLVDQKPSADARRIVLVTETGGTRSGYEADPTMIAAEAVEGFVSHFATCPQAAQWRHRSTP